MAPRARPVCVGWLGDAGKLPWSPPTVDRDPPSPRALGLSHPCLPFRPELQKQRTREPEAPRRSSVSVQLCSRRGRGCVDSTRQDGRPKRQVSVPTAGPSQLMSPLGQFSGDSPRMVCAHRCLLPEPVRLSCVRRLMKPTVGPWLCRLGVVSMVLRAREVHFGCLGGQQGLKAPGMRHGYGAGVGFALLLALDLQGGEGGTSPCNPLLLCFADRG